MFPRFTHAFQIPMIISAAALFITPPALAGDNNVLFITQTGSSGGLGNSLFVDQSLASDSIVAGNAAATIPATQSGGGNVGEITLDGSSGLVVFNQTNTNPLSGTNIATIVGGSLASIVLQQNGFGNTGTLDIGAGENSGTLTQLGDKNTGTVNVSGTETTGILNQNGNKNTYLLDVTGDGSTVTWNQIGNANAVNTAAMVTTNAGTVTVTQQGF